jgi:monovalent cation/hydrogen antiporter
VLKAESIINDGTALVLFGVAVSVAIGGAPVGPIDLTVRFVLSYLGGIVAGLLVGGVVTLARLRLDSPQEEAALSLLTPFAAFLLADSVGCSGVVAVLVAALMLAYASPRVIRARSRLVTFAFWDIATFLINGALWVFVGVQLPSAVRGVSRVDGGIHHAVAMAVAVTIVVVATRILWGEATTVLIRSVDRRAVQRERRIAWRQRMVSNWAGFRGAVSLAAALAVPLTTRSGAPFPDRNLIIFVVSFVILTTVLVQGSTLPAVVKWARIPADDAHADELRLARCHSAQAALDALPLVAAEVGISEDLQNRLHAEYKKHAALVRASDNSATRNDAEERSDMIRQVRLGVLEHRRRAVTELRDQRRIDDIVLLELQASMDLEEARLLGPSGPD